MKAGGASMAFLVHLDLDSPQTETLKLTYSYISHNYDVLYSSPIHIFSP
jgi:hypothetical protein